MSDIFDHYYIPGVMIPTTKYCHNRKLRRREKPKKVDKSRNNNIVWHIIERFSHIVCEYWNIVSNRIDREKFEISSEYIAELRSFMWILKKYQDEKLYGDIDYFLKNYDHPRGKGRLYGIADKIMQRRKISEDDKNEYESFIHDLVSEIESDQLLLLGGHQHKCKNDTREYKN